jgi:Skp family chaperone for outer membrane proteins
MIKTFVPAVLLALGATAGLAEAQAMTAPKIAVIDMQRISNESALGKSYATRLEGLRKEIEAEGAKKQGELEKLDTAIKGLQEELEKQAGVLSPEGADRKRQDIVKKTRERQAFFEDGQADLTRMRERAQQQAQALNNEFQTKVKPVVEAVAKEKGVDILLDNQVAMTLNNSFDISADVITRIDATLKPAAAGAPAAGTPAAAAKPASPAPAKKP